MRELVGAADSAQLARELEVRERGNLFWWHNRYEEDQPRPTADPEAERLVKKWLRREVSARSTRRAA